MKGPIQTKFELSSFPTLQYSNTPKQLAPVPAKPLNSDLALKTRFSMLNNRFQHYTREQKVIKLESVCSAQRGIMFRALSLLDNPTLRFNDTVYNDESNINI